MKIRELINALLDNTEARRDNTEALNRYSEALEDAMQALEDNQPHAVPTYIQTPQGLKMTNKEREEWEDEQYTLYGWRHDPKNPLPTGVSWTDNEQQTGGY